MADIVMAFPGLFSYEMLVQLDLRDFNLWHRLAKSRMFIQRVTNINDARVAFHAEKKDFTEYVEHIIEIIEAMEQTELTPEQQKEQWEAAIASIKSLLGSKAKMGVKK